MLKAAFAKVAEVHLTYTNKLKPMDQPRVNSSYDAFKLFNDSWEPGKMELQEQFRVMLLDKKNGVMGISTIATGGMSECIVDIKLLFALALKSRGSSIIVAHNHPSGNDKFSDADKKITAKIASAGKLLDLPLLNHLVITKQVIRRLLIMGCF